MYRIVKAEGRELTNLGMATDADFVNNLLVPNGGSTTMQNYTQLYSYDELGNMLQVQSQNRWIRNYYYESGTNRLLKHDTGSNVYSYDAHGNMLTMTHLQLMAWNYKGNLVETDFGKTTKVEGVFFNLSGATAEKIIKGVPRVEDKIIKTFTPKLKGAY